MKYDNSAEEKGAQLSGHDRRIVGVSANQVERVFMTPIAASRHRIQESVLPSSQCCLNGREQRSEATNAAPVILVWP